MNIRRHLLLSGVLAAMSTCALAANPGQASIDHRSQSAQDPCLVASENNGIKRCDDSLSGSDPVAFHTPEIDGASAITAGAMLAGILALVGERRRRKDQ
jgi:hypothetical protein